MHFSVSSSSPVSASQNGNVNLPEWRRQRGMSGSGRQGPLHVWRKIQPLFSSATEEVFVARTCHQEICSRHNEYVVHCHNHGTSLIKQCNFDHITDRLYQYFASICYWLVIFVLPSYWPKCSCNGPKLVLYTASPSIPVRYTAPPSIPVRYTASPSITNSTKSTLTSLVSPKY